MMTRASGAGVAALCLLLTAPACGSRGGAADGGAGTELARNALPGPIGRTCHFVSDPADMPPFSRLARTGTRGNIALWGTHAEPTDSVTLSVRYDDEGHLAWVRSIDTSMPREAVASLEQLLMGLMNERGPADWGVRLRVRGGQIAALEPSVICPAVVQRTGGAPRVRLPSTDREFSELMRARGRRFRIQFALDEQGRVVDIRLPQLSGGGVVDQFLLDWAHARQFDPKLHDGFGIPAIVYQTVHFPRRH